MSDDQKPKNVFVPGGPERFAHQKRGLQKIIQTRGVCALLFDPGTGKTATTLDFISILALKAPEKVDAFGRLAKEARVLVVAPLAAIDTWVLQSEKWVADGVNYWAEALGGSIAQRAEALAARGGQPFLDEVSRIIEKAREMSRKTGKPIEWGSAVKKSALFLRHSGIDQKRAVTALKTKFTRASSGIDKTWLHDFVDAACERAWQLPLKQAPRALHVDKSVAIATRAEARGSDRPLTVSEGPDGLGKDRPRFVLLATNFDTFSSRQMVKGTQKQMADHLLDAVRRFDPDLVVVDEAHRIKSPTSNVSRLLGRVGEIVQRRMALTGTIMPAGPLDVFGVWRFLEPFAFGSQAADGSRKRATFSAFKDKYAVMGGYMGQEVKGYKNLDEMQNVMAINSSVARKRDALPDLPKATDVEVPILLSPQELKAYKEMKKGLATELVAGNGKLPASAGSRLTQILRLRQITSGHLPDDLGNMHILGESKADAIESLVDDTLVGEDRIVIFCYFKHEIAILQKKIGKDKKTTVLTIDGDTHPDERLAIRRRFGDREKNPERIVLITQIRTMSLAVNELVTASNAIFGSLPQTRDDIVQARDRLDRIGQVLPCTFWFVLAPGTVDTAIFQAYKDKTSLESAVLAHILDLDPSTAEELDFLDEDKRQRLLNGEITLEEAKGELVSS